jgi:CO/xanthine dehydrogenase Mo-binding subunit
VVGCFAYADLGSLLRPLPLAGAPPQPLQARVGFRLKTAAQLPLVHDRVRYVGEPVAVVLAADPYAAEDALELIDVDYEPLPAIADVEAAVAVGAAILHEEWGDNVGVAFQVRIGDPSVLLRTRRYACAPASACRDTPGCRSSREGSWPSRRSSAAG